MRNTSELGNTSRALNMLRTLLPKGWVLRERTRERKYDRYTADVIVEVVAPDGAKAVLLVEAKSTLTARDAVDISSRLAAAVQQAGAAGGLIATRFASEMSQDRIRKAGLSYIDTLGNSWIALDRPGLLISTRGATKDPTPEQRGVRSLKGAKAARIIRALCDWRPPIGVRDLAARAQTDAGYTSRVLRLLQNDDLITRGDDGRVSDVNWQNLLRQWSRDYDVAKSNRASTYLAPRGLSAFSDTLRSYERRYALTGSMAVPSAARIAASPLASCYVDDMVSASEMFDLRSAEIGGNVILLEPFDDIVYERSRDNDGLTCVALTQCAVDMLSGSGREPSQADSLIDWMRQNEDAWRS